MTVPQPPRDPAAAVDLGIPGLTDPVEIGRGGSGVVYRARQPGLNRVVAVKVLSAVLDRAGLDRFDREAFAMGTVAGHPNIVQVLTTGATPMGRPYLVMPYVEGGSLADRLPVPWQQAVSYGVRLSGALETAHRAGVLHRDVKPSNVLISAFGEPLLADFGIARVAGGFETSEGLISASIPYASPEVLDGRPGAPAGDIYALAATIFCAITGRPPFAAGPDEALVALYLRIVRDPVPDLRGRGVPDAVCRALESALSKDPTQRPASAGAFGRLLQDAQRTAGEPATPMAVTDEVDRTTMAAPSPSRWVTPAPMAPTAVGVGAEPFHGTRIAADGPSAPPRRRGWIVLILAVVLVITAGVVGTVLLWPEKGPPPVPGKPSHSLALKDPSALALGADGALYIADEGANTVVRVAASGEVDTVAGTGKSGDSGDGRPATGAELDRPGPLAVGADNSLYIGTGGRIRRIDPQGLMRPVTGFDDYTSPTALAAAPDGSLYAGADDKILVRRPSGEVSVFAQGFSGVKALVLQANGVLLVSDSGRGQVFGVSPAGAVTPVAGADGDASDGDSLPALETKLASPGGIAVDSHGALYVTESGDNRIRRVQSDGTFLTIAGNPDDYSAGNEGDGGDGILATFSLGEGPLVVDGGGMLYVADTGNHRIRRVTPAGTVEAYG